MSINEALSFGERIIAFNASLRFSGKLPPDIRIMNPFQDNEFATPASKAFYRKYYADSNMRGMILGINPGRFGAGITGVPFTDPKRMTGICQISMPNCPPAHEPSSEFIYEVVQAWGGPKKFYSKWYINSLCPLGFIKIGQAGKATNYNFYDSRELEEAALPFMLETFPRQLAFGIYRDVCFCLGSGKNADFLRRINKKYHFFGEIIALEHPRYIMQYKSKEKASYIEKYITTLKKQVSAWEKKK